MQPHSKISAPNPVMPDFMIGGNRSWLYDCMRSPMRGWGGGGLRGRCGGVVGGWYGWGEAKRDCLKIVYMLIQSAFKCTDLPRDRLWENGFALSIVSSESPCFDPVHLIQAPLPIFTSECFAFLPGSSANHGSHSFHWFTMLTLLNTVLASLFTLRDAWIRMVLFNVNEATTNAAPRTATTITMILIAFFNRFYFYVLNGNLIQSGIWS